MEVKGHEHTETKLTYFKIQINLADYETDKCKVECHLQNICVTQVKIRKPKFKIIKLNFHESHTLFGKCFQLKARP